MEVTAIASSEGVAQVKLLDSIMEATYEDLEDYLRG